ncbi:MAG: hypothetical protein KC593_23605 [Myxococcales bacterium]|nr:hypothetical protein [Myxococcales bacterium]MCB9630104.1 hypothetical protein [Sandaracinaceae bacterium]
MSDALGWQDIAAWLVVLAAVGFLVDRFFLASRRKKPSASKKPDVPVSALVRKRPKR